MAYPSYFKTGLLLLYGCLFGSAAGFAVGFTSTSLGATLASTSLSLFSGARFLRHACGSGNRCRSYVDERLGFFVEANAYEASVALSVGFFAHVRDSAVVGDALLDAGVSGSGLSSSRLGSAARFGSSSSSTLAALSICSTQTEDKRECEKEKCFFHDTRSVFG